MRSVSIPDDIEDRSLPKASGRVTPPRHVAWSFPYRYDLDDRKSLRSCYETVMTEGFDGCSQRDRFGKHRPVAFTLIRSEAAG